MAQTAEQQSQVRPVMHSVPGVLTRDDSLAKQGPELLLSMAMISH